MPVAALPRPAWNSRAIVAPGLASGILYPLSLVLMLQQFAPGEPWPIDPGAGAIGDALALLPVLGLAIGVGLVLALAPLLIGVVTLARIGRWNAGTRHPAFWALVGAAIPASVFAAAGASLAEPPVSALLCTGAACAALARRYVRWPSSEE